MSSGQDVSFSEDKVAQGQQLTNKLWNAARLILLRRRSGGRARAPTPDDASRTAGSSRGSSARRREVDARIERFDFSHAALELYDFVYGELCDWYLELVKPRLHDGERGAAATLLHVLTRDRRARPPDDPVRDRGDLLAHPGSRGPARGARRPAGCRRRRVDERAEASAGARDRGRAGDAGLARRRRGQGRRRRCRARLAAERLRGDRASTWRGCAPRCAFTARRRGSRWRAIPVPGGAIEILRRRRGRPRGRRSARAERRRAKLEAEIERAERKLANEGFVAKAPPGRSSQAERDKLTALRDEAASRCERAEEAERYILLAASCSGCGSAWTGCGG